MAHRARARQPRRRPNRRVGRPIPPVASRSHRRHRPRPRRWARPALLPPATCRLVAPVSATLRRPATPRCPHRHRGATVALLRGRHHAGVVPRRAAVDPHVALP
jgi:hypothetical protein